jgi:hypothetical protein
MRRAPSMRQVVSGHPRDDRREVLYLRLAVNINVQDPVPLALRKQIYEQSL